MTAKNAKNNAQTDNFLRKKSRMITGLKLERIHRK